MEHNYYCLPLPNRNQVNQDPDNYPGSKPVNLMTDKPIRWDHQSLMDEVRQIDLLVELRNYLEHGSIVLPEGDDA
jgi:hypothetical protein